MSIPLEAILLQSGGSATTAAVSFIFGIIICSNGATHDFPITKLVAIVPASF